MDNQLPRPTPGISMLSMKDWTDQLATIIADTLRALAPRLNGECLSIIALDCHPWNGSMYLAILKRSEIDADPEISDPEEMASWELYDCGEGVASWHAVAELASAMQQEYSTANEPASIANDYLAACAAALSGRGIHEALATHQLDDAFRLTVTHPDSGQEFCAKSQ